MVSTTPRAAASSRLDKLFEKTVIPSFTRIGPVVRRRRFGWKPLDDYDLKGRTVVLTGATSGIGEAAAKLLARCGATLVLVARSERKADTLCEQLREETGNPSISRILCDLGKQDDVRRAAQELRQAHPQIDVLVHNAGALFNERQHADNGTDLAVELMVSAPFLLTGLLLDALRPGGGGRSEPGRVLTMSSGGMYTEALSVSGLEMPDDSYQGAEQYARAKRAQVSLNELWAEKVSASEVVFHCLHPGWVNTPGINDALPGFSKVLTALRLLRTPEEGADTLVWLSADKTAIAGSGQFWLDRAVRDTHMMASTRSADTPERRERLWRWCEQQVGWQLADD